MKNREDIKNYILKIEQQFPVDSWKVNHLAIWPILRIKLFFYLINVVEAGNKVQIVKKKKLSILQKIKTEVKKLYSVVYYFFWMKKLPTKKYLFVGADAHRVNFKSKRFNRYFDILIDKYQIEKDSLYFEYGHDTKNQFNLNLIYTFNKALKGFLLLKKKAPVEVQFSGNQFDEFINFLKQERFNENFLNKYNTTYFENWASNIFFKKVNFFTKVLKKMKPTQIMILCYYTENNFALIVAANQLGIKTIEMQHGPQTDIHLSYGSWTKIPPEGYSMLPTVFWSWDEHSEGVLNKWIKNSNNYSVINIGNPWVDFWKTANSDYEYKDYVFYSLQPNPITIEQLFPKPIIDFIKNKPYSWFIRLHPRQMHEIENIKNYLKKYDVLDLVNIEQATNDPLPKLLINCAVHVTHFSGSALEASFLDVFTVLINETGIISFPELISAQKAVYLNVENSDFNQKFEEIIQNHKILPQEQKAFSYQENLFT
ncbi:hypothetical protein M0M57_02285 [Flavobacterium azooxidireducens]|uniref:Uncharacterized protein n=1 Tax=Flavobacterium azooxidireducens TaxID=1871076 RepID=A0ABY4KJU0_9FLAO|nr:hypothetical protein [Flavobacterium azooxidireducens]UPQ79675.1 hypothetical protein M0M57_02285 [Flavobacterium azooxidireducens]